MNALEVIILIVILLSFFQYVICSFKRGLTFKKILWFIILIFSIVAFYFCSIHTVYGEFFSAICFFFLLEAAWQVVYDGS